MIAGSLSDRVPYRALDFFECYLRFIIITGYMVRLLGELFPRARTEIIRVLHKLIRLVFVRYTLPSSIRLDTWDELSYGESLYGSDHGEMD